MKVKTILGISLAINVAFGGVCYLDQREPSNIKEIHQKNRAADLETTRIAMHFDLTDRERRSVYEAIRHDNAQLPVKVWIAIYKAKKEIANGDH